MYGRHLWMYCTILRTKGKKATDTDALLQHSLSTPENRASGLYSRPHGVLRIFLYTTQDRHRARLVMSSRTYISWFYSDWVVAKVLKAGTSQLRERLILLRLLRERRWCLISVFRIQSHSSETESGSGRAHFRPLCLAYSQSYQRADS